ncbi:MAG TPA: ATP-binding protein, partial [Longimicrobiales bacterium]|nr:ATP-binding protein [Longimicrobiales bacterium]
MSADADRHLDLVPDGRSLDVCPSLRTLVRDLSTAAAVVDFDGHAWIWNAAAETLFPPPPQHASTTYPLFSLGTQPWFSQAVAAARAGRGVDSISWRPRGLGGERFWLGIAMTPARGRDDKVVGMVALLSDHTHTERRRRRTLRRALRAEYILDAAPDGVIVHQSNRIVYANRAAVRLLGATHRRALLGEPIADRLSPFDGTQATLTRIDGTACTVDVRSAPVRFRTRPATELTVREIESCLDTDDRRTDDQLRQAQRMEAIGRLAGGIAHDFSNLLTAIQGHVQFLLDELPLNHPSTQDAQEIKRSADRASTLTRQLLAFSRRQEMELREVDLNDIIGEMGLLLRRVINEDILLQTTFEPALWRVRADRGQIEQVLINLVVNARDALPQGGVVTIRTANVELDEEYAGRKLDVVSGQYVLLSVSDNGIGMDRETQSHIFEPFFTTKEPGKGT